MIDKRQVMYDIERCISGVPGTCMNCSHYTGTVGFRCMESLMSDAHALLKEQEPKTVLDIADSIEGIDVGKCPRCDKIIVNKQSDPTRFCKYCGQAVKWG